MDLDSEREEVIHKVENAFEGITRKPGVSLSRARCEDDRGTAADQEDAVKKDKSTDTQWAEVSDRDLIYYHDSIIFFTADEFRYYLPAYMIWSLRNIDEDLLSTSDSVLFMLAKPDYLIERRCGGALRDVFNAAQCAAIMAFLGFASRHFFEEFDRKQAACALERWKERPAYP